MTDTHITDEMVEAALESWFGTDKSMLVVQMHHADMRAALEAASLAALPPLTSDPDIASGFPDGTVDRSTFDDIETALDRAEAPCTDGRRWLTLPERIAALTARAEKAEAEVARLTTPRPLDEYHEDYGPVLWHRLPIEEPPYVGWPSDDDWPDYHTHWTPLPDCNAINKRARAAPEPRDV